MLAQRGAPRLVTLAARAIANGTTSPLLGAKRQRGQRLKFCFIPPR